MKMQEGAGPLFRSSPSGRDVLASMETTHSAGMNPAYARRGRREGATEPKKGIGRHWFRSERSQSMTEFALVAPILLVMLFGIIDFGRVMYIYGTLVEAANEGARVAIRASSPLPNDANVEAAAKNASQSLYLANPCPNGPLPPSTGSSAQNPPPNQGWIFITEPNPPSSPESNPTYDAPGGETPTAATSSCSAVNPFSSGTYPLQVTVRYNYQFFTPVLEQLAPTLVLQAYSTDYTEY
jgi:TadE-like protein